MNSNLAEVGKPTRWPPGKSGNPAGKPPGTRTAFSQGLFGQIGNAIKLPIVEHAHCLMPADRASVVWQGRGRFGGIIKAPAACRY
jgi:hypothetical protein